MGCIGLPREPLDALHRRVLDGELVGAGALQAAMFRGGRAYATPKAAQGGRALEEEQMRPAAAVGCAKSREWHRSTPHGRENSGPLVLAVNGIVRVPDLIDSDCRAQVVDVPVRSAGDSSVMADAREDATGTERLPT